MNKALQEKLIKIAQENQTQNDPSHDWQHVRRVFNLALQISKKEKPDLDILIPATLFHDIIVYQKNHPNSKKEANASAKFAQKILKNIRQYPQEKIEKVTTCIEQCSFSKGSKATSIESKILQDADRLEATGAISIMRTFSSGGQMNQKFYNPADPFCKNDIIDFRSNMDLFYKRLLVVGKGMHTKTAKKIAKRRTIFLKKFLNEFKLELKESKII